MTTRVQMIGAKQVDIDRLISPFRTYVEEQIKEKQLKVHCYETRTEGFVEMVLNVMTSTVRGDIRLVSFYFFDDKCLLVYGGHLDDFEKNLADARKEWGNRSQPYYGEGVQDYPT